MPLVPPIIAQSPAAGKLCVFFVVPFLMTEALSQTNTWPGVSQCRVSRGLTNIGNKTLAHALKNAKV